MAALLSEHAGVVTGKCSTHIVHNVDVWHETENRRRAYVDSSILGSMGIKPTDISKRKIACSR